MNDAKMAARNIFRYKRRSVITAVAIAVGVAFTIAIDGMLVGTETESERNIREYETGEAKVYPEGYFADRKTLPFSRFIEPDARAKIGAALDGYRFAPRVNFSAELFFAGDFFDVPGSVTAQVTAIDPARDGSVFALADKVKDGRWLAPGDAGLVLGSWLAADIGAKVGAQVSVECKGRGGFYQTFDAEVVGIVSTDNPVINRNSVFMDLSYADELLSLGGAVTEYTLRVEPASSADRAVAKIRERIPAGIGDVRSWKEVAADEILLTKSKSSGSQLYLFFMFVIAAVGISNTMLMAVMERKREIGMLRALGYGSFRIRKLFLYEGFGIGLLGAAIGVVAGCLMNFYMVVRGIDLSFMLRDMDVGYRLTGVMRSGWNVKGIVTTVVGALAISTVVAWFPSGKILKNEVADILRK